MDRPRNSRELYARLLGYARPYWKGFALTLVAMVVLAMTEPAIAALMKALIDGSFINRDPQSIVLMPVLMVLLFLVRGLASYASSFGLTWVSGKVVHDLRIAILDRLVALSSDFYHDNPTGEIISRVTFNVTQVSYAASNALLILVRDSLAVIGLMAYMLWLNWQLTLLFLVVIPAIALIMKLVSARMRRLSTGLQEAMAALTHTLEEVIRGIRVVKLFAGQAYERERFSRVSNRARLMDLKLIATSAFSVPLVQLVTVIALAAMIYLASSGRFGPPFEVDAFIAYFTAMGLLFSPIKRLTKVNEQLQRGLAASDSIFDLLAEATEPDTGTLPLERAEGRIEFEGVTLRYEGTDEKALDNVSLAIDPGETVALVGKSGSGKTSLATLIPRFYQPGSGRVLLDGHDLQAIRLADLRRQIALVSQDIVLFNGTVVENIAYGAMQSASEAEIRAAATAAHAMEFIDDMPQDLQTRIGEDGARLSGGQRQRIAIARALLKDAPILILDEATSALDTESERHVHTAIQNLMQGRTAIIIAHRLSTIEQADRIVLLDEGRIVESGTHQELLDAGGAYSRLQNYDSMEKFEIQP